MSVVRIRSLARVPFSRVIEAAMRRDMLLRTRRRLPALLTMGAIASASVGCVAVGGAKHQEPPTLGKQLLDLRAARDAGAITECEYAAAKAKMLEE